MSCMYCRGARTPCTCLCDCGARGESNDKWCPQAEGYVEYWRKHGYTEDELEHMKTQGYR